MALIECAECDRQISDKAEACPGCGAPPGAYRPTESTVPAEATGFIRRAAVHSDGRRLGYDRGCRQFSLEDTEISLAEVVELDAQRRLKWIRVDVMNALRAAAREGTNMADLPLSSGGGPTPKARQPTPQARQPSRTQRVFASLGDASDAMSYGQKNAGMVCPHCHAKGTVRTKSVIQKAGISGGKATAGILTGGLSLLATGLSRKDQKTEARCSTCGNTWHF